MQLSDLLDNNDNREIDLSKTRIKVTNFMDNQYQQLKYLANTSPLQSVSYDNIKVQTSPSNSIEDKAIKQLQAKEYIRIIDDCINSLDDIKKTIFKGRIIKKLYRWQVEQISGYGNTRMYELLNLGCLEFAQKLKRLTDIDLLEYKEWYNMDKEKITELRTYRIIDNTLDELTKQNKNIESLTNRNTGMILKRLERIQKLNQTIIYLLLGVVGLLITILLG